MESQPTLYVASDWGTRIWDKIIDRFESWEYRDTILKLVPLPTHTRLIFDDTQNGLWCYEAVPPRSHKVQLAELWDRENTRIWKLDVDTSDYWRIRQSAEDHLGDSYDFLGLTVVGRMELFGQEDRFYGNHHASMYCTEYAVNALRRAVHLTVDGIVQGMSVCGDTPAYDIDPMRFENWVSTVAKKIVRSSV